MVQTGTRVRVSSRTRMTRTVPAKIIYCTVLLFYINYEKNSLFLSFSSVGKKDYFRLKEWVWVGGRQLMICEDKELIELYPPSLFSYIHSSGERGIHRQATGIFTDRQQGCS